MERRDEHASVTKIVTFVLTHNFKMERGMVQVHGHLCHIVIQSSVDMMRDIPMSDRLFCDMYCPMPSDDLIVKKYGSQAGIEPTTFGELAHCSNQLSYRGPSWQSGHNSIM